ncbi:hypothetical protein GCM10009836_51950 [Pseudonocardia ailaonensis]|uniref:Uncharacterized protein n=1 Tax=Pseudonocardia ailaonensis TaxID=367279 RepID=A0ABN2NGD2_9PSEU
MAPTHHDWTRHGPGRCLLWWPLSSFVLMAAFPDAGILPIVLSGAGLAVLGVAGGIGAAMLRRRIRALRAARRPAALIAGEGVAQAAGHVVEQVVETVEGVVESVTEIPEPRRTAA